MIFNGMRWKEKFREHITPWIEALRRQGTISVEAIPSTRSLLAFFLAELGNLLYLTPDKENRIRVARELMVWQPFFGEITVWEADLHDSFSGIELQEKVRNTEKWILVCSVAYLQK
ncbi:MAG: hypothetical protein ACUVRN_03320, partial [Candidatus Caldatribacteriaceae bacterium]